MSKSEQLMEAWKRMVKSMAEKEGITTREAEKRAKQYFPELFELYEKSRQELKLRGADQS